MTDILLVIDTATRTPLVALADVRGKLIGEQRWQSRHRHGEELLGRIDLLLDQHGARLSDVVGVVVGTGPGSFTGLRIGLATAKTIAYSLEVPLTGVSTTRAIALAATDRRDRGEVVVTLPAGAVDRYEHRIGADGLEVEPPQLVAGPAAVDANLVAIDLDPPVVLEAAAERGRTALAGLGAALARMGAHNLERGATDDPAELVPAYVALPRGIAAAAAEMEWSPDLR